MTIGDLTPNMIGAARIRVTTRETVVEGLLSGLDITTDHRVVQAMRGPRWSGRSGMCGSPSPSGPSPSTTYPVRPRAR